MNLKVGITGGIGSGKSYVAKVFKALGVPFYDADKVARSIMEDNEGLRADLRAAFGDAVYLADGHLDRPYLSSIVFGDQAKLDLLNSIVHPVVIKHGDDWAKAQPGPYSLKEAALLFESGSYKKLDYTILVVAPEDLRIQRVMQRDQATEEQVRARIQKQTTDQEKMELADFIIINDEKQPLLPQVLKLHQQFLNEDK